MEFVAILFKLAKTLLPVSSSATEVVRFTGFQMVITEDFPKIGNERNSFSKFSEDSNDSNLREFDEKTLGLFVPQVNQSYNRPLINGKQSENDDVAEWVDLSNENKFKKSKSKRKTKKKDKNATIFMNNMFNGNIHF